jgi:hypothetical protein
MEAVNSNTMVGAETDMKVVCLRDELSLKLAMVSRAGIGNALDASQGGDCSRAS